MSALSQVPAAYGVPHAMYTEIGPILTCTDLCHCALVFSQEVIVVQGRAGIVNVIHLKLQPLHLLKSVGQLNRGGKVRV